MKLNLSLLKIVALVLFVIAAIMFFANSSVDVAMGLAALGLACRVAADVTL